MEKTAEVAGGHARKLRQLFQGDGLHIKLVDVFQHRFQNLNFFGVVNCAFFFRGIAFRFINIAEPFKEGAQNRQLAAGAFFSDGSDQPVGDIAQRLCICRKKGLDLNILGGEGTDAAAADIRMHEQRMGVEYDAVIDAVIRRAAVYDALIDEDDVAFFRTEHFVI